eukprot:2124938-Amphidinium_carterae.1
MWWLEQWRRRTVWHEFHEETCIFALQIELQAPKQPPWVQLQSSHFPQVVNQRTLSHFKSQSYDLRVLNSIIEALPQEAMLFDVMKRCLPTYSYLKLGIIDTNETDLPKPKTLADCIGKLKTYIQDVQIAVNLLSSLGQTHNVQLNSLRIYNVLNGFVHHMCTFDTVLTTKVVLLGSISDNMSLNQLLLWATHVLGMAAERVRDDKSLKQQQGPSNKPQGNAANANPHKGQGC